MKGFKRLACTKASALLLCLHMVVINVKHIIPTLTGETVIQSAGKMCSNPCDGWSTDCYCSAVRGMHERPDTNNRNSRLDYSQSE